MLMLISENLDSIITLVVAFGVAWFTSRWAQRTTHLEKVWERKSQAYSAIFDALFDIQNWFGLHLDDHMRHRDIDSATRKQRDKVYQKAKDHLNRTIAKEEWLLSETVKQLFKDMRRELGEYHQDWSEHLESGYGAVERARAKLVEIARQDLARSLRPR